MSFEPLLLFFLLGMSAALLAYPRSIECKN